MDEIKKFLVSYMEERELKSFKGENGCLMAFNDIPRTYARYLVDDEPKVREWLTAINEDGIIKKTINASTLSALVSHLLEEGRKIPDFVSVYTEPATQIRSGKNVPTLTI